MTTLPPSHLRIILGVLAALFVIVALPFVVLGVQEPHSNWHPHDGTVAGDSALWLRGC